MIVDAVGTPGSASTWMANVIAEILRVKYDSSALLQSDNFMGMDWVIDIAGALSYSGRRPEFYDCDSVVIKNHAIDRNFFNFLKLSGAHFICTYRDPRDSLVSTLDRFGSTLQEWSKAISRSIASVLTAQQSSHAVLFSYEDGFYEKIETIRFLFDILNVRYDRETANSIFKKYSRESVQSLIANIMIDRPEDLLPGAGGQIRDIKTHFNSRHLGDGKVGKWENLIDEQARGSLTDCFGSIAKTKELKQGDRIAFNEYYFSPALITERWYTPIYHEELMFILEKCWLPCGIWQIVVTGSLPVSGPHIIRIHHSTDFVIDLNVECAKDEKFEASFELRVERFDDPMNVFILTSYVETLDALRKDALQVSALFIRRTGR